MSFLGRVSAALLFTFTACGDGAAPAPTERPDDPTIVPTPPQPPAPTDGRHTASISEESPATFDLNETLDRLRMQFMEREGAFVATQPSHRVETTDGVLRFSPRATINGVETEGAALELETVAIERDGGSNELGTGAVTVGVEGNLMIDRGSAQEQVLNTDRGAQQAWVFAREPAGTGALTVRVAVSGGQRYLGVAGDKHYFMDEVTGIGASYSFAKWIALDDVETPIAVAFDAEHGQLVMTVPAALLAASSFPAVLDPTIGTETLAATDVGYGASASTAELPAVAFNGIQYLVVWDDARDRSTRDIWGTFVNSSGTPLDNTGRPFVISTNGDQTDPAIAFNAGPSNFLLVWEDNRDGAGLSDIRAQRFDGAGTALGAELVISDSNGAFNPDVAVLGSEWVVTYEEHTGPSSNVVYRTVSSSGVLGSVVALNGAASDELNPAIACNASNCAIAFSAGAFNSEDVFAQRVNAMSVLDARVGLSGSPDRSLSADVATDGTDYFVTWADYRNRAWEIYGNGVNGATGAASSMTGALINAGPATRRTPSVAFSGGNYLVAWADSRTDAAFDVRATRVSPAGAVLDGATGFAVCTNATAQQRPVVAAGASQWLVSYEDAQVGRNVRGTTVSTAPAVGDVNGVVFSRAAERHSAPALAWGGAAFSNQYLLVFTTNRGVGGSTDYDIVGVRLTAAGAPTTALQFIVSGVQPGAQASAELAFNGAQFLVVWQDNRNTPTGADIRGTRFNDTGVVDAGGGLIINQELGDQTFPSVAWSATANAWIVAYSDRRAGTANDLYFNRVDSAGTVLDGAGVLISNAARVQTRPSAASSGNEYLVTWQDNSAAANQDDIMGVTVSSGGMLGVPFTISAAANRQEYVDAHWNGTNYIVVWQDGRNATADIYGARVTTAGTVLDTMGVALANSGTLAELRPRAVTFDADRMMLIYSRAESAGSPWSDLYGQDLTPTLGLVGGAFAVSTVAASSEDEPTVAVRGPTNAALAYQRYDSDTSRRTERVFTRRVFDAERSGCADGEREGFTNVVTHPNIAACAGGFRIPGVTTNAIACARGAGDDSAIPDGTGCRADDICAAGWHVCDSPAEITADSPTGCVGATGGFYASRTTGSGAGRCDFGDTNDVFGCGDFGATTPLVGCGPINRFTHNNCSGLPGSQWLCGVETTEATTITHGDSLQGGVLCCRD